MHSLKCQEQRVLITLSEKGEGKRLTIGLRWPSKEKRQSRLGTSSRAMDGGKKEQAFLCIRREDMA
jgi:hypothetical protein